MKNNLPVTGREFKVPSGMTLMSTTDLRGCIVYANAAFVHASGFENKELVGQPHNVVRHPDMPAVAFADMWSTLQAGLSWTAPVKNRRKNGDHYWVLANATPMLRGGQVVGYMSVRTPASEAQSRKAQALYADLAAGRAKGFKLHRGLVVRTGLRSVLSLFQLASVQTRLLMGTALAALAPTAAAMAVAGAGTLTQQLVAGAAGLGGMLLGGGFLWRQIGAPLRRIRAQAMKVAAGAAVDGEALDRVDDVGLILRAVTQSGLNVRALLDDVAEQAGGVAVASRQIAAGSDDLSGRTEQTAASLEQTAASMQEITHSIQQNASTSAEARTLAEQATEVAAHGDQAMQQVRKQMTDIQSHSARIGNIVSVIDSIAFQTNILALNAAVESARAGEAGRGFAVVASEVRALAQRSSTAAREIKVLIEESVQRVDAGDKHVAQASATIQGIVKQVQQVASLVSDITDMSLRQGAGVQQVHVAVTQLDGATQQNAALVEQSAAAAAALSQQADRLTEAVSVYRNSR